MGRTTITARERVESYKSQGLYATDDNTIFCKYCSCSISWGKKDTLNKHVASSKHINKQKQLVTQLRQTSLVQIGNAEKRRKVDKEYFSKRTVEAFAKANIPLEKLENKALKDWIDEFTGKGGELSCVKSLREKYVPALAKDFEVSTASELEGKVIHIMCDETTDKVGRCVFVIIFHVPESENRLVVASVSYLDACNATTCSRAVLDALSKYKINFENVHSFVSDGARYMTLCFETLKVVVGDQLKHIQCWAHKLCLLGNAWVSEMEFLNRTVTAVKAAFLNTRKRKHNYLKFLTEKHGDGKVAKLFPSPVITRWNSWFHAVFYLSEYFSDIVEFFSSLEMKDINNSGINFLSHLTDKEIKCVIAQAMFVKEHAKDLVDLLVFLEGSKYLTSHLLWPKLDTLDTAFAEVVEGKLLQGTTTALAEVSTLQKASILDVFKKAATSARQKLYKLREKDPNRENFSNIAHALSPTMILFNKDDKEAGIKKLPGFSALPSTEVSRGYGELKALAEIERKRGVKVDVEQILHAVSANHELFAKCCLQALWTPTNNVDSERLLSNYSNVVNDKRTGLKESNAELFTALSFQCKDCN